MKSYNQKQQLGLLMSVSIDSGSSSYALTDSGNFLVDYNFLQSMRQGSQQLLAHSDGTPQRRPVSLFLTIFIPPEKNIGLPAYSFLCYYQLSFGLLPIPPMELYFIQQIIPMLFKNALYQSQTFIIYMLTKSIRFLQSTSNNTPLSKLLTKVPKTVISDMGEGFLARIFDQSKKSPTYILLKELFAYLQQSSILAEQFPFIKSDERFQQNWMVIHLQILKSRLRQQKGRSQAINELQLQKLSYNAKLYFFPAYAKYLNPHVPAQNYATHFSEAFDRRFQIYDQQFYENYQKNATEEALSNLLRSLVYENRVSSKDSQLCKLVRYYSAHRRYLSMLEWSDLVSYKVKWGFEAERGLLQELGKQ